jgi:N,N'-diacetyllegionaminate synthase
MTTISGDRLMIKAVKIKESFIGPDNNCFVIAEAGVNHNGDMSLAFKLIKAAAKAGADAIKFQSFIAEEIATPQALKAQYQAKALGNEDGQLSMLKSLELSNEQQKELMAYCDEVGIMYICTPYDELSADLLDKNGIYAYKIASTDVTNIPFLRFIAKKGKPVLLSTGMSTLGEVEEAINELKNNGLEGKIIVLQCTSEYPAPVSEVNLRAMKTFTYAFGCPVGFSDHTKGVGASPWAVAAGASVIEKHFTLDKTMNGPDHLASIEPDEFQELVKTIREVEVALGDGFKTPSASELPNKISMQKSLVATRLILEDEVIQESDLACKRPGSGLPPKWKNEVVGKKAARSIKKDEILGLSSFIWT